MMKVRFTVALCGIALCCPLCAVSQNRAPRERIHRVPGARVSGATLAGPSPSGYVPYHNGATLLCSDCHTMHYSRGHDMLSAGNNQPGWELTAGAGPNARLLKSSDSAQLCLSCHDGIAGIPDVIGDDANGLAERSAGEFADLGVSNYKGHNLSGNPGDLCERCHFSGTMPTASVTCVDCHNPHGNNKARNLQWASWPGGEPGFAYYINPSAANMQKYERQNIGHGYGGPDQREITNICIDCHHSFFDDSDHYYTDPDGDGTGYHRHPGFNSEWGAFTNIVGTHGTTNPTHWLAGTGSGFDGTERVPFVVNGAQDFDSTKVLDASTNGVFCLSCHKAHGGTRAYSLTWPVESGIGPKGCNQCHATP